MAPSVSAVVVHWRNEEEILALLAAWPRDGRSEVLVVDNSSTLDEVPAPGRLISPGRNLGFAGGVNRGTDEAQAPWVLILNPDVVPEPGAVDTLLNSLGDLGANAAGVVPALDDEAGQPLTRWQLRPLPNPWVLLAQTFLVPAGQGPAGEPPRGTAIAQPAGAALALRREVLQEIGGLDEGYHPAWFEDVDLAVRLARAGHRMLFEPNARFRHAMGASLPALGYGPFLWIYYRNLTRYLQLHHGTGWARLAGLTVPCGMLLRLVLLPLRRPRRAISRRSAAEGLLATATGALSRWRRPASYVARFGQKT